MKRDQTIQEIPIEDIIPNRFQPRLTFNEDGIKELAESIKQHGIIQPLVVRPLGDKYEIIAGERRYKASTLAGLTKVPVIVSDIDDNKSAEVALVENIQRRNLTSIEEAKSYKKLLERGYLTQEQLADKMGVSQSTIANKLRLLNLDNEVQDALLNEKISERHARALLSLEDKAEQRKWLKRIIEERMPVRQLDMELKKLKNNKPDDEESGMPLINNINPNLTEIMNNAQDINVTRELHNVEEFMKPQNSEPQPIEEPKPIEEEEKKVIPNKFFNFLEDEQTNMNTAPSLDIFNKEQPIEEPKPIEEPTHLNPIDFLDEDIYVKPQELPIDNTPELPSENKETVVDLNPIYDQPEPVKPTPETPETPSPEPKLESFAFANLEGLIDPLDSIEKLDPKYEEIQEEKAGLDFKTTINDIRDNIEKIKERGIDLELEEADLEDTYQITIKIKK